jgi:ribonuclease Z
MTSVQAAEIAKKSNSKKLVLTHISQRYRKDLKKFLSEAKKVFKNSSLVSDLDIVEV